MARQLSEARRAEIQAELDQAVKLHERIQAENKIFFFNTPNPPQQKLLDAWEDDRYRVFSFTGGNRSGKTTIGVWVAIACMLGEWPWSGEKMRFPHNSPRRIRYVGQGWETHIKAVLIPKLDEWWPKSRVVDKKKNNQGVDYFWTDRKSRSTLEIMSNNQDSDIFEGWDGDLVIYDEPPKREIRVACARGLIDRRGKELFCATLLKEAWIHREVIKARTEDGKPDLSVFSVEATIYDNVGFGLTKEGVDQFAKTLTPEEREARLYGKPSYMTTLVCPKFDRQTHIRKPFKVPLDWVVDIAIDFHPSKPWAVLFMATGRNNFKYVFDELWIRGNPKFVGEEIIRVLRKHNLNRVEGVWIDPLAKGDANNDETVFEIVAKTLGAYGYSVDVASKDKENGIAILNNLLMTENEMPGLFFFDACGKTIEQIENWMYDPDTFKPSKSEDDFCECLYRLCLRNTQWYEPLVGGVVQNHNVIL